LDSRSGAMAQSIINSANEDRENFWVESRKRLFRREFVKSIVGRDDHNLNVLEIGPGVGENLDNFLGPNGERPHITDVDLAPLTICQSGGHLLSTQSDAASLPYRSGSFDFVLAGDVLEHCQNDAKSLMEIWRVVRDEGSVVLTVPAFMVLWSRHDELAGHKRRYRKHDFLLLCEKSGFQVQEAYYFNFILFLPTLVTKKALKLVKPRAYVDATSTPSKLNALLLLIMRFDIYVAPKLRAPFGISIFVRLKKQVIE
jgi:ubiquinone/menaquinone biosynthesis C-methylase UbiE